MKARNRRRIAKVISVLQQGFIVATLGSLFVFVPLHSQSSTLDGSANLLRQTTGATDSHQGVGAAVTPTQVFLSVPVSGAGRGQGEMVRKQRGGRS